MDAFITGLAGAVTTQINTFLGNTAFLGLAGTLIGISVALTLWRKFV